MNYLFSNKSKIILLTLACLLVFSTARARSFDYDDVENNGRTLVLDYGLNIGAYFANRGTANYYNGSTPYHYSTHLSKLEYIFENSFYRDQILQEFGHSNFSLYQDPYPERMVYRPTFMVGLFGAIYFNPSAAIIGDFNFAKLKTEDWYILVVDESPQGLPDYKNRPYPIWGVEDRYDIRLGFQYTFLSDQSYIHPFFEIGANMTNTLVKENSIRVGSRTFPLHRQQSDLYYQERDYGVGFGGFVTAGAKMTVNEQYSLWIGYSANMNNINLGNNQQYLLQHTFFLRLSLAKII